MILGFIIGWFASMVSLLVGYGLGKPPRPKVVVEDE